MMDFDNLLSTAVMIAEPSRSASSARRQQWTGRGSGSSSNHAYQTIGEVWMADTIAMWNALLSRMTCECQKLQFHSLKSRPTENHTKATMMEGAAKGDSNRRENDPSCQDDSIGPRIS